MSVESSNLNVGIIVPYVMREKDIGGVSRLALETRKRLNKINGINAWIYAPSSGNGNDEEETLADETIGRAVFSLYHHNTKHCVPMARKKTAREKLLSKKFDLLLGEEPANLLWHTVLASMPKRADGSLVPATIDRFHARIENWDWNAKLLFFLGKAIRRPEFNRFWVPKGLTAGVLNTNLDVDGRIAVSNATAEFAKKHYGGDYRRIYNGVDTEEIDPEGPKINEWLENREVIIYYAGRHEKRKGVDYLLKAIPAVNEYAKERNLKVRFKIGGEGPETEKLKKLAQDLKLDNVDFVGVLSREEYLKALRTAHIGVFPATGGEGFGLTVAEAAAAGEVVVASHTGGYDEVVGGTPYSITPMPKSPEEIAQAINTFLSMEPWKIKELSQMAILDIRSRFGWEVIEKQLVEYFDEIVTAHGKPRDEDWEINNNGNGLWLPRTVVHEVVHPIKGGVRLFDKLRQKVTLPTQGIIYEAAA